MDQNNWQIYRDGVVVWEGPKQVATQVFYHAVRSLSTELINTELFLTGDKMTDYRRVSIFNANKLGPWPIKPEPGCIRVEWDTSYWGGDYEDGFTDEAGVSMVPYALVQTLGLEAAFFATTGEDPQHIVWHSDEVYENCPEEKERTDA